MIFGLSLAKLLFPCSELVFWDSVHDMCHAAFMLGCTATFLQDVFLGSGAGHLGLRQSKQVNPSASRFFLRGTQSAYNSLTIMATLYRGCSGIYVLVFTPAGQG